MSREEKGSNVRARVLVVDDESAIRDSLRMILEYEGYGVVEAATGESALAEVRRQAPDAVVLDIKMPEMDGLAVLKSFRERGFEMPVLIVTGHGDVATAAPTTSSKSHSSATAFWSACATPWRATGCAGRRASPGIAPTT